MIWDWSNSSIRFDQQCWTFDGDNGCSPNIAGGGPAGSGYISGSEWRRNASKKEIDKEDLERRLAILRALDDPEQTRIKQKLQTMKQGLSDDELIALLLGIV